MTKKRCWTRHESGSKNNRRLYFQESGWLDTKINSEILKQMDDTHNLEEVLKMTKEKVLKTTKEKVLKTTKEEEEEKEEKPMETDVATAGQLKTVQNKVQDAFNTGRSKANTLLRKATNNILDTFSVFFKGGGITRKRKRTRKRTRKRKRKNTRRN